jgi:UDP-N-acetylmuramoyl-tripeptide--D-alanyl-D-alanine ligase
MKPLSLAELASMSGGRLLGGQGERHANRVCTDSRQVQPGDLFIALRGENFDGHDYVPEVEKSGAVAAMVSDSGMRDKMKGSLDLILVDDTLKGLQRLAKSYRQQLPVKVVAVTGSNGKTSTKDFIAAVLGKKYATNKTVGNLNNHIGVPLTVLQILPEHEWAVIEMGMNHPGELDALMDIANPDWSVITNVGWAHIEAFENQQDIAVEKASVLRGLPVDGRAFLNKDDQYFDYLAGQSKAPYRTVGHSSSADIGLQLARITESRALFSFCYQGESYPVSIQAPAWHMVQNAGLAIAVGLESGVPMDDIAQALGGCDPGSNRLNIQPFGDGLIINDTYNASPDSMAAAFDTLAKLPVAGRRVALLGSMGELGAYADRLHLETGRKAIESGIEFFCAYGFGAEKLLEGAFLAGASSKHARIFDSHEVLYKFYESAKLPGDVILVKGSRSQRMERVVEMLLQRGGLSCSTT